MLSIVCRHQFSGMSFFYLSVRTKKHVETSFNIYHLSIYIFWLTLFGFYYLGITIWQQSSLYYVFFLQSRATTAPHWLMISKTILRMSFTLQTTPLVYIEDRQHPRFVRLCRHLSLFRFSKLGLFCFPDHTSNPLSQQPSYWLTFRLSLFQPETSRLPKDDRITLENCLVPSSYTSCQVLCQ